MVEAATARGEGEGRRRDTNAVRPSTSSGGGANANGGAAGPGAADGAGGAPPGELSPDDDFWDTVKELVIERQQLRRLASLTPLRRMWRASFAGNEISRIEGLERCTLLEELSLEDNRITAIEGLNSLTKLRKLDLGKNRVSRCHGLSQLTCLTQLSLEDNNISSLAGLGSLLVRRQRACAHRCDGRRGNRSSRAVGPVLAECREDVLNSASLSHIPHPSLPPFLSLFLPTQSLMELYLGNNQVTNLREINSLKALPRLIILDLIGNPIVEAEDYRLYTVFHLRKLKVLDSVPIDLGEAGNAKQRYAGRLTRDLIEERLGHSLEASLQLRESFTGGGGGGGAPPLRGSFRGTGGSVQLLADPNATGGSGLWDGSLRFPGANGSGELPAHLHHSASDPEGLLNATSGNGANGSFTGLLESLDLSQCRLRDLGGVFSGGEFQALREVNFDSNLLTDIRQLAVLPLLHVRTPLVPAFPFGPLV